MDEIEKAARREKLEAKDSIDLMLKQLSGELIILQYSLDIRTGVTQLEEPCDEETILTLETFSNIRARELVTKITEIFDSKI